MRIFIVMCTRKAAVYSCAVCLEKDSGAGFEREPEREVCVHIVPYIYNSTVYEYRLRVSKLRAGASCLLTNARSLSYLYCRYAHAPFVVR